MNYVIGKLETTFRDKKGYFFIVLIMFCLGISFGLYAVKYMGEADKNDLISYFNSFADSIKNKPVNYTQLLVTTIKKNLIFIIPMVILSITFIGFPFILIIDLIKGFTLGYTFSFIVYAGSNKGLLLGVVAILPQYIFYIPCFIALSVMCLKLSADRFKIRFFNIGKKSDIIPAELLNRAAIIIMLFSMGILVETYVTPAIIKMVL